MSSRHSRYKSHADRVWPRAAERSPRTYKVRAILLSLAFEGLGFAGVRGAALHRIGCLITDGGATSAVQLAAKNRCRHMARREMPRCWTMVVMVLKVFKAFHCSLRHRGIGTRLPKVVRVTA